MSQDLGPRTYVARIAQAPPDLETDWLHPAERAICSQFASVTRRASWLAGRWWAKRAILRDWNLDVAPSELRIESRALSGLGKIPTLYLGTQQLPIAISLSHSSRFVAVTAYDGRPGEWGLDLVEHETRDLHWLHSWFVPGELHGDSAADLLAGWAAKEASHNTTGLEFRPRRLRLHPCDDQAWEWQVLDADEPCRGRVHVYQEYDFRVALARRESLAAEPSRTAGPPCPAYVGVVHSAC